MGFANGHHELELTKTDESDGKMVDKLEDEIDEQSPIEEVALTVPTTDDPSLPVLTFRMWVLGLSSCVLLAALNQFFFYRANPLSISVMTAQIAVLPLGQLMAATLPTKKIRFPGTKWQFSLNPGPFNMKEHVLITIFATAGTGGVYAIHIVTIMKNKFFYDKTIHPLAGWLLAVTTQMLGFGWAGIFRKSLVESAYMWWPANLVQVSVFSEAKKGRGGGFIRHSAQETSTQFGKRMEQAWLISKIVETQVYVHRCTTFVDFLAEYNPVYPAPVNDESLHRHIIAVGEDLLGQENVNLASQLMVGEDFSFYQQIILVQCFILAFKMKKLVLFIHLILHFLFG